MNTPSFEQLPDDPEWWGDPNYTVAHNRPAIQLLATTDGNAPDPDYAENIVATLSDIDSLILAAAELILDNYSYDHFKSLGVPEASLVKDETPEAIAAAVTLKSIWFNDSDCESFEMSFSAPWDDHHSFDVEFDGGEATCCAVNR